MAFKHRSLLPATRVVRKILKQFWGVVPKTGEKKPQLMGIDTELLVGCRGLQFPGHWPAPSMGCAGLCMSLPA